MTATRNAELFENLAVDGTYQITTCDLPTGRIRWHMALYGRIQPGTAATFGMDPQRHMWNTVTDLETDHPADGDYRTEALAWLAKVAGPEACRDCVLVLPDVVERVRQ